MSDPMFTEDDIIVFNDTDDEYRQEFWTNGEWIRVGRDILGTRYIEVRYETLLDDSFVESEDTLRLFTSHTHDNQHRTYCIKYNNQYGRTQSLDVYCNMQHVLSDPNIESGVISKAIRVAEETRESFDYVDTAKSYIEHRLPNGWILGDMNEHREGIVSVSVLDDTSFSVSISFIETLREDENIMFETDGNVVWNPDEEAHEYRFSVLAKHLSDAPE